MVNRTFFAIDSEAMTVSSTSPTLAPGSSIINNSDTPVGTIFEYRASFGGKITLDDTDPADATDVFHDDRPNTHRIVDGNGMVNPGTRVEAESLIYVRARDSNGFQVGPTITLTVFSKDGVTQDVWGFASSETLIPGTRYVKTGGNNLGHAPYASFVACFTPGTLIRLPFGEAPIETLFTGQDIWTEDGPQPLAWIGRTVVNGTGKLAPVAFAPGTVGNTRELVVSPMHCIVAEGARAELISGSPRVLVPARHFVGQPGVHIAPCRAADYIHIMFDRHRVIMSNGALTESFFPGTEALSGVRAEQRAEILSLFPELSTSVGEFGETALPVLKRHEALVLLAA